MWSTENKLKIVISKFFQEMTLIFQKYDLFLDIWFEIKFLNIKIRALYCLPPYFFEKTMI